MSLLTVAALLSSCGGAEPQIQEPTAPERSTTAAAQPAMSGAILTTAVDSKGESAAPASTTFARDTSRIYLVAELTGLAPDTKISVRWNTMTGGEPIHIFEDTGSGDHKLVADLPGPSSGFFDEGKYGAFVYANGEKLGGVDFRIGGQSSEWTGVRGLQISSAITAWTREPIAAKKSFPSGTKRVYATFQVRTNEPDPYVTVTWLRDGGELARGDLKCGREVRCVDSYEKGKQLPAGQYEIEVEVNGEMLASRSFHVGGDSVSPMLLHAALGVAKGKKRIPRRHKEIFKAKTSGMRCGVKVSNLPDEASFKVLWIAVTDGGDEEKHVSKVTVTGGGTKTAVLDWPVEGELAAGRYKAVVKLGARKLEELEFTVE